MEIFRVVTGEIRENCYVVVDEKTKRGVVIDPGDDAEEILRAMEWYEIAYIFLTHTHYDHVLGSMKVHEKSGARVVVSEKEREIVEQGKMNPPRMFQRKKELPRIPDVMQISGGETFEVDSLRIRVLATPGHTSGSVCYRVNDAVFTGDTLFAESIGRTDLPTGDHHAMMKSLRKLFELPGDMKVYPGHGKETTIAKRKEDFENERLY